MPFITALVDSPFFTAIFPIIVGEPAAMTESPSLDISIEEKATPSPAHQVDAGSPLRLFAPVQ